MPDGLEKHIIVSPETLVRTTKNSLIAPRFFATYRPRNTGISRHVIRTVGALKKRIEKGDDKSLYNLFELCGQCVRRRDDDKVRQKVYKAIAPPLGTEDERHYTPFLYEIACGYQKGRDGYPKNTLITAELFNLLARQGDAEALFAVFELCGSLTLPNADSQDRRKIYEILTKPVRPTAKNLADLINSGIIGMVMPLSPSK